MMVLVRILRRTRCDLALALVFRRSRLCDLTSPIMFKQVAIKWSMALEGMASVPVEPPGVESALVVVLGVGSEIGVV